MTQNDEIAGGDQAIRLRSYQEEVLEKSLRSNVIVAMPTGSEHIPTKTRNGSASTDNLSLQAARLTLLLPAYKPS